MSVDPHSFWIKGTIGGTTTSVLHTGLFQTTTGDIYIFTVYINDVLKETRTKLKSIKGE